MNDDIQISLGELKTVSSVDKQRSPAEDRSSYVAIYGDAGRLQLQVYIRENAIRGIREHALSSPENEVGGALIGGIYKSRKGTFIRIDDFIVAKEADEQHAALTFTHETWQQLNSDLDRSRTGLKIVGWYHTHPDFGVFLSDNDKFIHRNFFTNENMVALVVDPTWSEWAVFQGSDDNLQKASGFYVFGSTSRKQDIDELLAEIKPIRRQLVKEPPPQPEEKTSPLQKLKTAVAACLVLAVMVGGGIGIWNYRSKQLAKQVTIKHLEIHVYEWQELVNQNPSKNEALHEKAKHFNEDARKLLEKHPEDVLKQYQSFLEKNGREGKIPLPLITKGLPDELSSWPGTLKKMADAKAISQVSFSNNAASQGVNTSVQDNYKKIACELYGVILDLYTEEAPNNKLESHAESLLNIADELANEQYDYKMAAKLAQLVAETRILKPKSVNNMFDDGMRQIKAQAEYYISIDEKLDQKVAYLLYQVVCDSALEKPTDKCLEEYRKEINSVAELLKSDRRSKSAAKLRSIAMKLQ